MILSFSSKEPSSSPSIKIGISTKLSKIVVLKFWVIDLPKLLPMKIEIVLGSIIEMFSITLASVS